jgi:hypothetical protein
MIGRASGQVTEFPVARSALPWIAFAGLAAVSGPATAITGPLISIANLAMRRPSGAA